VCSGATAARNPASPRPPTRAASSSQATARQRCALSTRTGRTLWSEQTPGLISAGVAVAGRWVVTGTGFQIPGSGGGDAQSGIVAYTVASDGRAAAR
jgi:hypothetical protein